MVWKACPVEADSLRVNPLTWNVILARSEILSCLICKIGRTQDLLPEVGWHTCED